MGSLILGLILLFVGLIVRSATRSTASKAAGSLISLASIVLMVIGAIALFGSSVVIIEPGAVGVQHAFGKVKERPLLAGIHVVPPWAQVERYSTREEQWPSASDAAESMAALSSEQMGMTVDVAVRWQIDPMHAPRIFTEIGREEQIHAVVVNAIRNGVRDGLVQFSINEQQDRAGAADSNGAAPGGGRAPAVGSAAAPESDAYARGADEAGSRGVARHAHLEQSGRAGADGRGCAAAGSRGAPAQHSPVGCGGKPETRRGRPVSGRTPPASLRFGPTSSGGNAAC